MKNKLEKNQIVLIILGVLLAVGLYVLTQIYCKNEFILKIRCKTVAFRLSPTNNYNLIKRIHSENITISNFDSIIVKPANLEYTILSGYEYLPDSNYTDKLRWKELETNNSLKIRSLGIQSYPSFNLDLFNNHSVDNTILENIYIDPGNIVNIKAKFKSVKLLLNNEMYPIRFKILTQQCIFYENNCDVQDANNNFQYTGKGFIGRILENSRNNSEFTIYGLNGFLGVEFGVKEGLLQLISNPINIDSINFNTIDHLNGIEISSILDSSSLSFIQFPEYKINIYEDDFLIIKDFQDLYINNIKLNNDFLEILVRGSASSIKLGQTEMYEKNYSLLEQIWNTNKIVMIVLILVVIIGAIYRIYSKA